MVWGLTLCNSPSKTQANIAYQSTQPLPLLKPLCSSQITPSVPYLILFAKSYHIFLKLVHSYLSPLPLYKGNTHALAQSTGTILVLMKYTFNNLIINHSSRSATFQALNCIAYPSKPAASPAYISLTSSYPNTCSPYSLPIAIISAFLSSYTFSNLSKYFAHIFHTLSSSLNILSSAFIITSLLDASFNILFTFFQNIILLS